MIEAVFRRWLKVPDPTALTALETLQRALAFGRTVQEVGRSDLWVFRWSSPTDPVAVLDRLARETNLLQNPNKHRHEIVVGSDPLNPRGNVQVLVAEPEAGSGLAATLARHRLVPGEVPQVRRGTLWELGLDAEGEALRELAERIAVARGRREGLLANPHVERAEVLSAAPTATEVARILFLGVGEEEVG